MNLLAVDEHLEIIIGHDIEDSILVVGWKFMLAHELVGFIGDTLVEIMEILSILFVFIVFHWRKWSDHTSSCINIIC